MIYIVDTYAWVEYLIGSKKGGVVKQLLEDQKNKFITLECCLAELKSYALKNNVSYQRIFSIIRTHSSILPVLRNNWVHAAIERHKIRKKIKDFGMIDSILVAKQKELGCSVISGDSHFKNLKNIVYLF